MSVAFLVWLAERAVAVAFLPAAFVVDKALTAHLRRERSSR